MLVRGLASATSVVGVKALFGLRGGARCRRNLDLSCYPRRLLTFLAMYLLCWARVFFRGRDGRKEVLLGWRVPELGSKEMEVARASNVVGSGIARVRFVGPRACLAAGRGEVLLRLLCYGGLAHRAGGQTAPRGFPRRPQNNGRLRDAAVVQPRALSTPVPSIPADMGVSWCRGETKWKAGGV